MTDTPVWRKKYEVLSISRWYLHFLGFTPHQIALLSEEDMQRFADIWNNQHFLHQLVQTHLLAAAIGIVTRRWNRHGLGLHFREQEM